MKAIVVVLGLSMAASSLSGQGLPSLATLARIGCADCEGPTSFGGIQAVALYEGRVYVLDNNAPYVRVFTTDGQLLRAFARKGQGPGELQFPFFLGVRAGGELEVFDMAERRFTRYDSTGAPVGTRLIQGFTALAVSAPGDSQTFILQTDFRTTGQPILRVRDGSSEGTTVLALSAEFPKLEPGERARTPAFAANPRGGGAVGDGIVEYRIRRFDSKGRVLGDIVRDIPKLRKSPAELAAEEERVKRRIARMSAMAQAEGASPRRGAFTPRPEHNHFDINGLAFDDAGRLWVRTPRGRLEGTVFDLFDPDGRYLGEVRVPMRVSTYAVQGGLMAGVVVNEDDVPYVQLWRVGWDR